MEKKKYSKKYRIMRILFLLAYFGCMLVLVVESLTPGKKSAQKSNAVGNVIGGFINDIGGDQAKEIDATSCTLSVEDNKQVFSIGEKVKLTVKTEPETSTHKSYEYISSDPNIAKVSSSGTVSFIGVGEVTITVINLEQKEITTSITLESKEILPTKLTQTIDAPYIESDGGYYELEKGSSYPINNLIKPADTTNQKVSYKVSDSSKISISNDSIYAKDVSDTLIKIESSISSITNTIYVKVIKKDVVEPKIELESITVSDINKYTDELSSFTPSVRYNPTYTSDEYRGYILESLNEEIVKVNDNKLYLTGTVGSCDIRIISKYNQDIEKIIKVTVKARSNITGFDINYSSVMYENKTQKLYVKNVKPSDAKIKSYSYSSGDESILTVSNNGEVRAKAIGSAGITISVTDTNNHTISKTIYITVKEKPTTIVDDFTITYLDSKMPIVYINEEINLNNYFKINKFYNNGVEITPENKTYYFTFDESKASLNGSKITPLVGMRIDGFIYYRNTDDSIVAKEISLYVISSYSIGTETKSITYNLNVKDSLEFNITDLILEQTYNYSIDGSTIKVDKSNKKFKVIATDAGTSKLTITPVLGDIDLSKFKKEIVFTSSDVYTTNFDIKFKDKNGNYIDYTEDYELYINSEIDYEVIIDKETTKYNVLIENLPNFTVKYHTITPNELGYLKLAFVEEYSELRHVYNFKVKNYIHIDEKKLYNITGEYIVKDNAIEIINGQTVRLEMAFFSDSTYKNVIYKSSDESVLKIYSDGTISPQNKGEAIVTMTVNDGQEFKQYSLNFTVHKKNVIDDMSEFMYYVRKGLGHFGAFLILGICSTFAYMLFFRRKLTPVGIILNFALGFLFAGFTEYLQTLTPGRVGAMSDILIDYSGFLTSSIIITVVLLTIFIVKYIRLKNNNVSLEKEESENENLMKSDTVNDNDTENML